MKRLLSTMAASFAFAGALSAQHPNEAPGFAADRVYSVHDVDTVNAYNGNLIIRIPIGPEYKVNGSLSYQLALTYNSHFWRFQDESNEYEPNKIVAHPPASDNAGLGWRLSLGKLYDGGDPDADPSSGSEWIYQSADGADHNFYDSLTSSESNLTESAQYTRDGSHIRLSPFNNVTRHIEFPDGTVQTFTQLQPRSRQDPGTWQTSAISHKWFLSSITDPFGNIASIAYLSSSEYKEIWTITDVARTTIVNFTDGRTSDFETTLSSVILQAVGGQLMSYAFAVDSDNVTVPRPLGDTSGAPPIPVPLLSSVRPVVGTAFIGNGYSMPAYDTTTRETSGVLNRLVLPTLGSVGWSYENIHLGDNLGLRSPGIETPTGVATRTTYDATGTQLGLWNYKRKHSDRVTCNARSCVRNPPCQSGRSRQVTVFIIDPPSDGVTRTTINYFSNYEFIDDPQGDTCPNPEGWVHAEHGLPFTRYTSKNGRFLSSEVRTGLSDPFAITWDGIGQVPMTCGTPCGSPLRETYVTYRVEPPDTSEDYLFDKNASLSSTATYYTDDINCGGTCFTATNFKLFDGYGHYKQTSTEGNLPGNGNFRTTFTNYNATPTTSSWLLTPFSEQCLVDEDRLRAEMPTSASCASLASPPPNGTILSGPFVKQYCFDGNGFLARERSLVGTGPGAHDLLAVFTQLNGNVAQEDYYGGDSQTLSLDGNCNATLPDMSEYSILHEYEHGILKTSHHRPKSGEPIIYDTNNIDTINGDTGIDVSTGLVTASADPAGLTTLYSYDLLGRLTDLTKPGEANIHADYIDATSTSGAHVVVTQSSAAGVTQNTTIVDALGRVVEEQRLMPAGTARRQTIYTAAGLKWKVSEWEATPSHFTVFSNFDAFGRPGTITRPDYTTSTIAYIGARSVARTVSVGEQASGGSVQQVAATTTETYDGAGRLIKVEEPDGISTASYGYDAAGRLLSVSMTSPGVVQAQPRTFVYDGRGLLTSEQHPENGTTYYKSYDSRGHAGRKLVGSSYSPFDLKYEYDALERLANVYQLLNRNDPPDPLHDQVPVKQFTFATANIGSNYQQGKLVTSVRKNYLPSAPGTTDVTETYQYADSAGRVTKKTTAVQVSGGPTLQKYEQSYAYNDAGLPATITYPSCPDAAVPCATSSSMISSISPTYQNGLLRTIPYFATPTITYDLNGMVTQIDHPGGISDVITGDPNKMARPAQIQFNGFDSCASPLISSSPASQQITSGSHPTLQVAASGTPLLTYEWFKDGSTTPIPGETTSTCCAAPLTTTANFVVSVINSCGKADSSRLSPAVVTICGSPAVSITPVSAPYNGTPITLTSNANGCAPLTYQWFIGDSPTGSPIAGATSPSLTISTLLSTTHYWLRVTDNIGGIANSNTAIITLGCNTPTISVSPANTSYSGTPVTLTATATGCAPLAYQWYIGDSGNPASPTGTNTPSFTTPALQSTTHYWARVTDNAGGTANSNTAIITVPATLLAPGPLHASFSPGVGVAVVWTASASPGVDHYQLDRLDQGVWSTFSVYGTSDTFVGLPANRAYAFRVRAADSSGNVSPYSANYAVATTMTFATVQNGIGIAFSQFEEIRTEINLARAAQIAPSLTWRQILDNANFPSVPVPAFNARIYAAHILALRAALNAALLSLGVPTAGYTDSLTSPTAIKALHIYELQQRAHY